MSETERGGDRRSRRARTSGTGLASRRLAGEDTVVFEQGGAPASAGPGETDRLKPGLQPLGNGARRPALGRASEPCGSLPRPRVSARIESNCLRISEPLADFADGYANGGRDLHAGCPLEGTAL